MLASHEIRVAASRMCFGFGSPTETSCWQIARSKTRNSAIPVSHSDLKYVVRYFFRRGLAKLSYYPLLVRLKLSEAEQIRFWWSRVEPFFDPARSFADYWGHDAADLRFVWNFLRPPDVFLDIGAYHGIYSVVAARRMARGGRVFAFEPSPHEHQRLRLHLKMNALRRVSTETMALSAEEAEQRFFQVLSGDKTRGGLKKADTLDQVLEVSVRTVTLDTFVRRNSLDRIDLIKLDVEGAERDVLAGGKMAISTFRPVFLCEVLDSTTRVWGYPAAELISILKAHDYSWFDLCPDGSLVRHTPRTSYTEVRNYVAVPGEVCGSRSRIDVQEWQSLRKISAPSCG